MSKFYHRDFLPMTEIEVRNAEMGFREAQSGRSAALNAMTLFADEIADEEEGTGVLLSRKSLAL